MSGSLADRFTINRNFQRSKRLDKDLQPEALEGYRLNETAWRILEGFCEDVASRRQRAFTWTGPYGSGKSSLALLLSAILSPKGKLSRSAARILGKERARVLRGRLKPSAQGWVVVRVVGRREAPIAALWAGLVETVEARFGPEEAARLLDRDDREPRLRPLLAAIENVSARAAEEGDGLLIVVDEMGKFLEYAASDNGDLYVFQEIAEVISRLKEPCAFLGILHQAFDEYARRSSQLARSEWAKVQGRFADVPFSIAIEEVVGLIGAAISGEKNGFSSTAAKAAAAAVAGGRLGKPEVLSQALAACAPLHPVTALLLGPISRRRFGQNERSVFSFLSSREPGGFGEFLDAEPADSQALYSPAQLWDYLQLNHEPTILASPDGGRWSEAAEAVVRAQRRIASTPEHFALAKTVALLDLFGRQFGIGASDKLLTAVFAEDRVNVPHLLDDLRGWSVIVSRRHVDGWGIFAGSDIDIEREAELAAAQLATDLGQVLLHLPDLPPIVAKRHYAQTGTMRVFERKAMPWTKLQDSAEGSSQNSLSGRIALVVGTDADFELAQADLRNSPDSSPVLFAQLHPDSPVIGLATQVAALERLPALLPHLHGDPAARRELSGRSSVARRELAEALHDAFRVAEWRCSHGEVMLAQGASLSELASSVCDKVFSDAPRIVNELLNRERPSSAAVAARRRLLQAMSKFADSPRLNIQGEPAELGLYLSLLGLPGIHTRMENGRWGFARPKEPSSVAMWDGALHLLRTHPNQIVAIKDIYALWHEAPYGLRSGVAPVFLFALLLAASESLALYIEGNFIPRLDEVVIDRLVQGADEVGLKWVDAGTHRAKTIERAARFLQQVGRPAASLTALDVTKPLVQFAKQLPGWTRRTRQLTPEAVKVRDALLAAKDPFGLLFRELPAILAPAEGTSDDGVNFERLLEIVGELEGAQQELVGRLKRSLASALGAELDAAVGKQHVAARAQLVADAPETDFRTRRFAQSLLRIADNGPEAIEAILTLAAGKPLREWTDADIGRAVLELNTLSVQFGQVEAAAVANSPEGTAVANAADGLVRELRERGLDRMQQRAALLYALRNLSSPETAGEAA